MKPFEISPLGEGVSLRLAGNITIECAREMHAALDSHLSAGRTLTIDAARLTRLDAAALQVLIAASRTASAVAVVARSDAWDEAFRRYAIENAHIARPRCS